MSDLPLMHHCSAIQLRYSCVCQVRTYSKTFWKRYRELGEDQGEKYIKQIERGEQRIQRQQDIMDAIAAKMDRYRNPWQVSTTGSSSLPGFCINNVESC